MARTKKAKALRALLPSIDMRLSQDTKRIIASIACFGVTAVLVLAFRGNAGPAGALVADLFSYLVGEAKVLVPVATGLLGFLFLKKTGEEIREVFYVTMIVGIALMFFAALAILDLGIPFSGGVIGGALGSLKLLFGFWASIVVYATLFVIGALIDFWELIQEFFDEWRERIARSGQDSKEKHSARKPAPSEAQNQEQPPRAKQDEPIPDPRKDAERPVLRKPAKQARPVFSGAWEFPPLDLLETDGAKPSAGDIRVNAQIIQRTLEDFGIPVEMGSINTGPTVTQYTLKPAQGVKLARIVALQNDLALALAAHPIRIEAPIPGQALVGIEVPNKSSSTVRLRSLLEDVEYQNASAPLLIPLGRNVMGASMFTDVAKLPHLLVAGATGTGKSIFIHNILTSLMYRNPPQALKFILIDPKRVELTAYDDTPYLLSPVIIEGKRAILALKWAVSEMDRRYDMLLQEKSRDINSYNAKQGRKPEDILPLIVIVIDELADLMALYGKELEGVIIRLAQMARATGIHLIVSTQRPSVEVITGLIKANITSRIAFQVASQIDSRTILDGAGAEKLLGRGDLLFVSAETSKPRRMQGPYVSEKEVERVVDYIKQTAARIGFDARAGNEGLEEMLSGFASDENGATLLETGDDDELYQQAYDIVVQTQKASASYLQRRMRVGYARAARLLDLLEARGVIGPVQGAKPRDVYLQAGDALASAQTQDSIDGNSGEDSESQDA